MSQNNHDKRIGLIGLGEMGTPMADNLISAGYHVSGYDLNPEAAQRLADKGGKALDSTAAVVDDCEIVITSLPSNEAFLSVARETLLPHSRSGQIFIETGTTVAASFLELVPKFEERGAALIDSPVSGGPKGVQERALKMFVGASEKDLDRVRDILEAIGGSSLIYHCGGPGSGQAMKGVNQLKMAFENAAYLEILAYAKQARLDLSQVEAIWPDERIARASQRIQKGEGNKMGVKFRELPYFVEDAEAKGIQLPIAKTVYDFCAKGEFKFFDDHRQAPAFWHELTKTAPKAERAPIRQQ